MTNTKLHSHHGDIAKRLKRAEGHLRSVIQMIEREQNCVDIAQQLHAVEKAIVQAKRALIQDHIDHCLESSQGSSVKRGNSSSSALAEFKKIARYL